MLTYKSRAVRFILATPNAVLDLVCHTVVKTLLCDGALSTIKAWVAFNFFDFIVRILGEEQ